MVANVCCRPTALYSFSFAPNYTARQIYPSGQDYVEYLYRVAERYRIIDKVQLNVDVTELRYIEEDQEWEVHLSYLLPGMGDISARERHERASVCVKREIVRAQVVVSCVGILVEPTAWPTEIPGSGVFEGDIIHSARWPREGNLEGKDVVVIGSGCSAAQLVPSLLQTKVKSVTQVMRTPPWVSPRIDEPFGKEAYARYAPAIFRLFPVLGYAFRAIIRLYTELLWLTVFQKSHVKLRGKVEETSLAHMRSKVPEKYHKIMTPRYSYGCKRRVFDSAWLDGMNSSRFRLVVEPLNRLEARTVILGGKDARTSESTRPAEEIRVAADVIVLATGFAASQFLHPLQVHGRHGVALHDLWDERGGVQAYMGTAIDGFPNFFMTVGPNTFVGHTSVMLGIENTVAYILNMIGCVLNGDARTVEPTREAALHWAAEIQRELPHTVFAACDSWYRDGKGWNSTMYPSVTHPCS